MANHNITPNMRRGVSTGAGEAIENVTDFFRTLCRQTSDCWDRTVAIVGCEGVGKTEIANQFALEFQETFPDQAWIDAEIESYIDDHQGENNKIKDWNSGPIQNCGVHVGGNLTATNIFAITGNTYAAKSTTVTHKSNFRFNIPTPTPHFKGRKKTMEDVRDYFKKLARQQIDCWERTVAIVGLGGMGKTETSYKFAAEYKESFPNVAWINAETESRALASFLGLAQHLKIVSNDRKEADLDLVKEVYQHLDQEDHGRVLFIFDNAVRLHSDEGEFGIMEYLPTHDLPNHRFPFILITTQTHDWERRIETFKVDELSEVESLEFFRSCFAIESGECDDLFKKLHKLLEGFPLVMNLAASQLDYNPKKHSVHQLKQQIQNYIDRLEKENNKILHDKFNRAWPTKYQKTLSNVWQLTFERIQQEENGSDALELLQLMSFLHVPIKSNKVVDMLDCSSSDCPHSPKKELEFRQKELIRILERFYTLRILNDDNYSCQLGIHRLVQFVVRQQMDSSKALEPVLFNFATDYYYHTYRMNKSALEEALHRIPLRQQALPYVGVLACRGFPPACKFVETRQPETKAAATIWRLYFLERGMKVLDENATHVLRELIELTKSEERCADRYFFGYITVNLLNDKRYCEHERDDGTQAPGYFELDRLDGIQEHVAQLILNFFSLRHSSCRWGSCVSDWGKLYNELADLSRKLSKRFIEADAPYSIITLDAISDGWIALIASLKYDDQYDYDRLKCFLDFWYAMNKAFNSQNASRSRIGELKTCLRNRGLAKELIQVLGFINTSGLSILDYLLPSTMMEVCFDGMDMRDERVQEVISSICQMAARLEKKFIPENYLHADSTLKHYTFVQLFYKATNYFLKFLQFFLVDCLRFMVSLCWFLVKLFLMTEDPPSHKFLESLSQLKFLVWMEQRPKLDSKKEPFFGWSMSKVPDEYRSNHFPQFIQRFSSSDIEPMKTLVSVSRRLMEDYEAWHPRWRKYISTSNDQRKAFGV